MFLFQNQTTNGDSQIFHYQNREDLGMSDRYLLNIYGSWDGCAVTAHYSTNGTDWSATDTDATFTQNRGIKVDLPDMCYIKLTLTIAGASTNITAELLNRKY